MKRFFKFGGDDLDDLKDVEQVQTMFENAELPNELIPQKKMSITSQMDSKKGFCNPCRLHDGAHDWSNCPDNPKNKEADKEHSNIEAKKKSKQNKTKKKTRKFCFEEESESEDSKALEESFAINKSKASDSSDKRMKGYTS